MLAELLSALIEWIGRHPHWAYLGVFLVAAGESLVIVGLVLPGVALMFGIGALVAAGALELGPTLLWATTGAVVGDGISFWIGRRFHQRLRLVWPFRGHPELLNRGVAFFHRHGGKSVLLARFIGPVRPILPAVAGMMDMPARRFLAVNVVSAMLWAPAYLLPGMVFGASMGLAATVAARLAALLLVLVCLLWFGLWVVRLLIGYLQPRAATLAAGAQRWSGRHRLLKPLAAALLDPGHPEARGLAVLTLLLALSAVLLAWLLRGWLGALDALLHAVVEELRTPVADRVLVFIALLGDATLLLTVLGAGCSWLMLQARHRVAAHWVAAALCTFALTRLLGLGSAHAGLSTAVYGFLAVMIARELSAGKRWIPYVTVALPVIPIAFSRLYLGAGSLSDVLTGAALGLSCTALFGIAYRRHPARAVTWPALVLVVVASLAIGGIWWTEIRFTQELRTYATPRAALSMEAADWRSDHWRRLPAQRHDLRLRERDALNLQFTGDPATLRRALEAQGWREPPSLSLTTALMWLSPQAAPGELAVLPRAHDRHHDVLRMVREAPSEETFHILRLWPTEWRLQPGATPLWTGAVSSLELRRNLPLFSYVATGPAAPLATLHRELAVSCRAALRQREAGATVLLVDDCAG
jgi:membrane protein DedA with SNARE-associated domain/membrane-associated phospholipid phosphatase